MWVGVGGRDSSFPMPAAAARSGYEPFRRLLLFVEPKNNNRMDIFQVLKYRVYHTATWTY